MSQSLFEPVCATCKGDRWYNDPEDYWVPCPACNKEEAATFRLPTTAEARERRDASMASVEENADELWRAAVIEVIKKVPAGTEFLVEEIREVLDKAGITVHDNRALGPAINSAAKLGLVEKSGFGVARTSNLSPKVRWRRTDRMEAYLK